MGFVLEAFKAVFKISLAFYLAPSFDIDYIDLEVLIEQTELLSKLNEMKTLSIFTIYFKTYFLRCFLKFTI